MEAGPLNRIIRTGETATAEFKSDLQVQTRNGRAELAKHALAIVNACRRTGHIVLGAHDDGTPSGVDHASLTEERLQNILNEYCEPSIEAALQHLDVDGSPVFVVQLHRRTVDLPYRAARTAGEGPILERGKIYYRYGRHSEEARFAEISSLFREGDNARARERRAASPADDYRYLSLDDKKAAMMRDWRNALKTGALRLSRRRYYPVLADERPRKNSVLWRELIPAEATVGGVDYLLLSLVRPDRIAANWLESQLVLPYRWVAEDRTGSRRLVLVLAHGPVGTPLRRGVPREVSRKVVVEREQFGWYAGSAFGVGESPALDAHLVLENVRSEAGMRQALSEVLDWMGTHADRVNLLPDT